MAGAGRRGLEEVVAFLRDEGELTAPDEQDEAPEEDDEGPPPDLSDVCGQTAVEDFVSHLLDDEGAIAFTGDGNVGAEGDCEIPFVGPATYGTGHAEEITFDSEVLTINASASTPEVTVEEGATSTVDYTVESVSCSGSSG